MKSKPRIRCLAAFGKYTAREYKMATLPARLVRASSKLGLWRRGFADEAAGAFSLTFATPTKVCLTSL